jgi:hypothetical protein
VEYLLVLGLIVGPVVALMFWASVNKRYRNAEARYQPELVVAQRVLDMETDDHFRQPIVSGSMWVAGRNDHDPTIPAEYFKAIKK